MTKTDTWWRSYLSPPDPNTALDHALTLVWIHLVGFLVFVGVFFVAEFVGHPVLDTAVFVVFGLALLPMLGSAYETIRGMLLVL